jgi:hypothetical protein
MAGFNTARKNRLDWLSNYVVQAIENTQESVTYGKVLDTYEYRFGTTERKATQDLDLVLRMSNIENIDGKLQKVSI